MSIWDRLLSLIGLRPEPGPRPYEYELPESVHDLIVPVAQNEGRPVHETLPYLVTAGLDQYRSQLASVRLWNTLTPAEQDAAALACLGYTNRQIADRLCKSPETVKAQMKSALRKFNVRNRSELHMVLSEWDFSAWGQAAEYRE